MKLLGSIDKKLKTFGDPKMKKCRKQSCVIFAVPAKFSVFKMESS